MVVLLGWGVKSVANFVECGKLVGKGGILLQKKQILGGLLVLALLAGTGGVSYQAGSDAGYSTGQAAGQESGYATGYDAGVTAGTAQGYDQGVAVSYDTGYAEGEEAGRETGYAEGYEAGKTAGYQSGYSQGLAEGKKAATAAKTASSSGTSSSSGGSGRSSTSTVTVYITKTGSKYHRGSCSYLRESKIAISLSSAKSQGYTACSRCDPPA